MRSSALTHALDVFARKIKWGSPSMSGARHLQSTVMTSEESLAIEDVEIAARNWAELEDKIAEGASMSELREAIEKVEQELAMHRDGIEDAHHFDTVLDAARKWADLENKMPSERICNICRTRFLTNTPTPEDRRFFCSTACFEAALDNMDHDDAVFLDE